MAASNLNEQFGLQHTHYQAQPSPTATYVIYPPQPTIVTTPPTTTCPVAAHNRSHSQPQNGNQREWQGSAHRSGRRANSTRSANREQTTTLHVPEASLTRNSSGRSAHSSRSSNSHRSGRSDVHIHLPATMSSNVSVRVGDVVLEVTGEGRGNRNRRSP
jgi:hypothetical protein